APRSPQDLALMESMLQAAHNGDALSGVVHLLQSQSSELRQTAVGLLVQLSSGDNVRRVVKSDTVGMVVGCLAASSDTHMQRMAMAALCNLASASEEACVEIFNAGVVPHAVRLLRCGSSLVHAPRRPRRPRIRRLLPPVRSGGGGWACRAGALKQCSPRRVVAIAGRAC
ncbi:MAG: hypothetical protein ACK4F6_19550, partial [Hylemonella sp.]